MTLKRVAAACAVALTMSMRVSAQTQTRNGDDPEVLLQAAMHKEQVEGRLSDAITAYKATVAKATPARKDVAAQATLGLARTYEKLGQPAFQEVYRTILRDYPDQPAIVAIAKARLGNATARRRTSAVTPRLLSTDSFIPRGISRDGRLTAGRDMLSGDFVLKNLQTGETKTIASAGAIAGTPAFSPDGNRLAFNWMERPAAQGGVVSLRIVSTVGAANVRTLFTADKSETLLVPQGWSADGRSVVADVADPSGHSLVAIDVESAARTPIGTIPRIPGESRAPGGLSPDGRYVAYVLTRTSDSTTPSSRIVLHDVISGAENELVSLAASNSSPLWTPDSSHILFASNRGGSWGLYAVGIVDGHADGEPIPLRTPFDVRLIGVSLSGDLFYAQDAQQAVQYVYVAERGVPGARAVQAFNGEGVSWSPDGTTVAFLKNNYSGPNGTALMTRAIATGEEHVYPRAGGLGLQQVRWARDGSGILVNVSPQNDEQEHLGGIYLFDLKNKEYKALTRRAFKAQTGGIAELSPDLKTIYIVMRRVEGESPALVALDIATGAQKVLYAFPSTEGEATGLALSPDGGTLALQTWVQAGSPVAPGRAHLTLVSTNGNGARMLYGPYSTTTVWSNFAWTPDGQAILFIESRQLNSWRLMRVATTGGEPVFDGLESATALNDKALPAMYGTVLSLSVSPDGSRVAFGSYLRPTQELWMLEDVRSLLRR